MENANKRNLSEYPYGQWCVGYDVPLQCKMYCRLYSLHGLLFVAIWFFFRPCHSSAINLQTFNKGVVVSDCCLTPSERFFSLSYIVAKISAYYVSLRSEFRVVVSVTISA